MNKDELIKLKERLIIQTKTKKYEKNNVS
jgi:hypothetical protein